jgi:hypothetical protein
MTVENWDLLKLFQEWDKGGYRRMMEGMNSSMVFSLCGTGA